MIIEPSGVGKLSDVAKAIENVKKDADIEIDGRITVVDGKKAKLYMKNFGEFFENQVEHASTVVISRTQMMSDEKIEECVHMLREKNAEATIISTPWEELGKDAILHALNKGADLENLLEESDDHEHHHHHDHDHGCEGSCDTGCNGCGGAAKDPKAQLVALLGYMLDHNESHARELDDMAAKISEAGMSEAAEQIKKGVAEFQKGNMYLSLALSMVKEDK